MAAPPVSAFTFKNAARVSAIVLPCGVSLPAIDVASGTSPIVHQIQALWDTGASHSALTKETAEALGLKPISKALVYGAHGQSLQNVYYVDIFLPNNVVIEGIRVTECAAISGHFDAIIGMDIISHGDFAVTNACGKTTVSFRIPSCADIDFVRDGQAQAVSVGIPRNERITIENPVSGETKTGKYKSLGKFLSNGWVVKARHQ